MRTAILEIRLLRNMDFSSIKYAIVVTVVMVMCFNIFLGYKVTTNCNHKTELATVELYCKRLLDEKSKSDFRKHFVYKKPAAVKSNGSRTISNHKLVTKSYRSNVAKIKYKRDDKRTASENLNSREVFNIITQTPGITQLNNGDKKEEIVDDGDKNSKGFQSSKQELLEGRKKFVINDMKDEKTWENVIKINDKTNNSLVKLKTLRGLKMDWWYDICMLRIIKEQTWHPLFPNSPQHETWISKTADEERVVGSHFRRIYGYLYTNKSGYYDFKLSSRDGADLVLLDTSKPPRLIDEVSNGPDLPEVFYISLGKDTMDYQDMKINIFEMFDIEKRNIWLKADNLYFIELVQGGRFFTKYKIEWRESVKERVNSGNATGDFGYEVIGKHNLMYTSEMSSSQTPSRIAEKNKIQQRYPVRDSEAIRLAFYKTPVLHEVNSKIRESNFLCEKRIQENKNISYMYQGYKEFTDKFLVYPKEHFDFIQTNHITLGKEQALDIAHKTFDKINALYNGELELENIVHMVTNVNQQHKSFEDWKRNIYFVELDARRRGENSIFRTSQFVQFNPDAGLCFLEDYLPKDEKVVVNILTPIRNQVAWLKYLIQMLEEMIDATNETNYQLVLIDNNSTDGDYEAILQNSRLKYLYLNLSISNFNKVKALNFGLQYVLDKDSIAYVMDLHLQMPLNMFDRIRKLTIQGKTAFSPTLLKLACGEHEQYTDLLNSKWLEHGTGMIAMYKSDWSTIKGYNEELFGNKWGGEDWEVIDRIFKNGLYLIHLRIPRFYHIHHSRSGEWYEKFTE